MKVLGIETSCDETGMAIFDGKHGLLANVLHSQVATHKQFGGVVPELASRDHIRKLTPLLDQVLKQANLKQEQIDAIAYTKGPGLVGALLVGSTFAKSLGYAWNVPTIGINHMEGHLLAPLLEKNPPQFPFVALLVSGGHTQLFKVEAFGNYTLLGETLDDAAGEAFDKTAKLLGLDYPGGPLLAKLAEQGTAGKYKFPRPLLNKPNLDFSFSGLKTCALNTISKADLNHQTKADIALAFQDAVIDSLITKAMRALEITGLNRLVVAGGVSANLAFRARLLELASNKNILTYIPRVEFCTDNGAMIAFAGYHRLLQGYKDPNLEIHVLARWLISDIEDTTNLPS